MGRVLGWVALHQQRAKERWRGMASYKQHQEMPMCLYHNRIWFLSAHQSSLEKVQGVLLIAAQASKWRSAPSDGNMHNWKVFVKTEFVSCSLLIWKSSTLLSEHLSERAYISRDWSICSEYVFSWQIKGNPAERTALQSQHGSDVWSEICKMTPLVNLSH